MTVKIPIDQLYLDPENYRFRDSEQYEPNRAITDTRVQNNIIRIISGNIDNIKSSPEIQDLISSFKTNGYVPVDKIQVHKIENKTYKVLEGNRRIATLKYLKSLRDDFGDNIGKLTNFDFNKIEVELYEDEDLNHFRVLMGLKHISGNKKWATINQAQLVKDMSDSGEAPDDICDSLAISRTAYNRYIRTYALIEEYKMSEYGSQFRSRMFVLFEEIIKNPNLRAFIGWDNQTNKSYKKENKDRLFSWFSIVEIDEGGPDIEDEESGNLGAGTRKRLPIIESQDQVRELKDYIDNPEFLDRMEELGNIKATISKFEKTQEDVAFATALDLTERGLDSAFRSISPKINEYYDRFTKLNQKMQTLGSSFGIIEGTIPDSREFHEANRPLSNTHVQLFVSSLHIKRYKRLQDIKVQFLNKINVFAGGNNAGKSTLAEIFYFLAKGTDPLAITDIVKMRRKGDNNYSNSWLSRYLKFNLPLDCSYTTSIQGNDNINSNTTPLSITRIENNTDAGDTEKGLKLNDIQIKLNGEFSTTSIYQRRLSLPNVSAQKWPVAFVTSQTTYKFLTLKESWNTVVSYPGGKDIVMNFLRNTFNHLANLKDINYSGEEQDEKEGIFRFELTDGNIIHLFDYGDGVQRCFAIALQAFVAKDGFLIIDELENGIHHSNFEKIANFLQDIQSKLNLQIFITSHSLEAIEGLANGLGEEIISYHTLFSRNNISMLKSYEGKEYKFALEQNGIDLRTE